MPFEEAEIHTRENAPPMATLAYTSKPGKKGNERNPSLSITLPTAICGQGKAERFVLLIGSGDMAGKIRIKGVAGSTKVASKDAKGVKPAQMKWSFRFNFGFVPRLGTDKIASDQLPLRKVGDDEFEIDVPASWFDPA
ncbi:hypothetical protein FNL56_13325 [Tardiphaga sp. vice304]|uniref:hypothetical protein n=1 Tax=Tardiphaga sp. vice304 TaxID=2592817 RepID=UPI00116450AE|nr:hypothetical protein [Tardiphaga sp. vice304]QDM26981.1 hypothetical protein FNL56_13325 [Tardiphaga sp. vice304]